MEHWQEEGSFAQKMVLQLVRNVKRTDSKTLIVGGTATSLLKDVQQAAANKFRIPPRQLRLFTSSGSELLGSDAVGADAQIRLGGTLIASAGEACVLDKISEGQGSSAKPACDIKVVAQESLVEAEALKQLKSTAELPGVVLAVGLPDLHVGSSCPVGAAIATAGIIYPGLVGSDIGCGVMLARTSLAASAAFKHRTIDRWAGSLQLEGPWNQDTRESLAEAGVDPTGYDAQLGTVGRGNHFAELQVVERVEDAAIAADLGLDSSSIYICVHSGSRGLGESIHRAHTARVGGQGLALGTSEAEDYMKAHDQACKWAIVNRKLIAARLLEQLQASSVSTILDVTHNSVVQINADSLQDGQQCVRDDDDSMSAWLHRKGAAPTDQGPVLIPGSRGAFSYLVKPTKQVLAASGWSLAHGAGRRLARSSARLGGKTRHPKASDLTTTALGSQVVCDSKDLLYEERPEAYKDVSFVVADLVSAHLCTVVALLRPVLTYKMRATTGDD